MRLNSLEQKISKTILGSILGIGVLGSGCETPEDYMLGSVLLGLGGLNPALTSGQVVALGVGRDVAGMGAGVAAQRETSKRIAGAIQGQGGTVNRQNNLSPPPYRIVSTPDIGTVHVDDDNRIAYGSGFIGYGECAKRPFSGQLVVCTEWCDLNNNNFMDFPDEFIGIGAHRTTVQKTSLILEFDRKVSGINYYLIDNSTGKEVSAIRYPQSESRVQDVFPPGKLTPSNYSAIWEADGEFLGRIVINITNP